MKYIEELYKYLPQNDKINWDLINNGILKPFYKQMEETNQDPRWHK